jgi:hypothetical protein
MLWAPSGWNDHTASGVFMGDVTHRETQHALITPNSRRPHSTNALGGLCPRTQPNARGAALSSIDPARTYAGDIALCMPGDALFPATPPRCPHRCVHPDLVRKRGFVGWPVTDLSGQMVRWPERPKSALVSYGVRKVEGGRPPPGRGGASPTGRYSRRLRSCRLSGQWADIPC